MSLRSTLATMVRVLQTLRRDPRTVALLVGVPALLVALFKWVFNDQPIVFNHLGVVLMGIFPMMSMFLVSSVTMLRERSSGTLERLMTTPVHKADLLFGYGAAFAIIALVQAGVVGFVGFVLLNLTIQGSVVLVLVVALLNALLGMSLGLLLSAFAQTEFQAIQFFPAVLVPQLILCGILVPRSMMATTLQFVADVLPLSYAYDALSHVSAGDNVDRALLVDFAVLSGVIIAALCLGAVTLRRRTP